MYFKDHDQWNRVKKKTDSDPDQGVVFRAGEIRWAILGVNVGSEIDGKGNAFTRPVLILHVIGKNLALVVPLSTKLKAAAGYENFIWKSREVSLCLHQMRVISQKRLLRRQGKISKKRLDSVRDKVTNFFSLSPEKRENPILFEASRKRLKPDQILKMETEGLSRSIAVWAVRNTFLETLHSGIVPQSKLGDYSDVKVAMPTGEIPWTEVSRFNDQEMKRLMKQVVNRLYTILSPLISGENQEDLERLLRRGEEYAERWDKAEIDHDLGLE